MKRTPVDIQKQGTDYLRRMVALVYREIGVLKTSNHRGIASKAKFTGGFFGPDRKAQAKQLYKLSLTDISLAATLDRYAKRTGLTLDDVYEAFRDGMWRLSSGGFAYGGPKWADIAKISIELLSAIQQKDWTRVEELLKLANTLEHNNDKLIEKFGQLD